jgi:hypothetical protein
MQLILVMMVRLIIFDLQYYGIMIGASAFLLPSKGFDKFALQF